MTSILLLSGCGSVHKSFSDAVDSHKPKAQKDFYGNSMEPIDLIKDDGSYVETIVGQVHTYEDDWYAFYLNDVNIIKKDENSFYVVDVYGRVMESTDAGNTWEMCDYIRWIPDDTTEVWYSPERLYYDKLTGDFLVSYISAEYQDDYDDEDSDYQYEDYVFNENEYENHFSWNDDNYDFYWMKCNIEDGTTEDISNWMRGFDEYIVGGFNDHSQLVYVDSSTCKLCYKDMKTGQNVEVLRDERLENAYDVYVCGSGIMIELDESFLLYDENTKSLIEDKCLGYFYQKAAWGISYEYYMASDYEIYAFGQEGIYRHIIGSDKMELIVDGRTTFLSVEGSSAQAFLIMDETTFLTVSDSAIILKYTYDPDLKNPNLEYDAEAYQDYFDEWYIDVEEVYEYEYEDD